MLFGPRIEEFSDRLNAFKEGMHLFLVLVGLLSTRFCCLLGDREIVSLIGGAFCADTDFHLEERKSAAENVCPGLCCAVFHDQEHAYVVYVCLQEKIAPKSTSKIKSYDKSGRSKDSDFPHFIPQSW